MKNWSVQFSFSAGESGQELGSEDVDLLGPFDFSSVAKYLA